MAWPSPHRTPVSWYSIRVNLKRVKSGVRITTCQTWRVKLNTNPLANLARCFSSFNSVFCAWCFLTWQVIILNYSPVRWVSWKPYLHPLWNRKKKTWTDILSFEPGVVVRPGLLHTGPQFLSQLVQLLSGFRQRLSERRSRILQQNKKIKN
jgi:hypothetical protein